VSGGRIVYSGPHSSFGNVVFVQSPQGYIYVYGGQDSVSVDIGDQIVAGQVLGEVGVSPTEGGPALYFSVWRENRFVDPEAAPRG
jgi:lipoprotein NlpD